MGIFEQFVAQDDFRPGDPGEFHFGGRQVDVGADRPKILADR